MNHPPMDFQNMMRKIQELTDENETLKIRVRNLEMEFEWALQMYREELKKTLHLKIEGTVS